MGELKHFGFCVRIAYLFLLLAVAAFWVYPESDVSAGKKRTAGVTIITIRSAEQTDYRTDKVTGDDCVFLEGNVNLEIKKDAVVTEITADTVNYNRTTDMLYAEGSVHLSRSGGTDGDETATAGSLLINTATLEGVFDDGRIVQTSSDSINLPSGSTLIVASDLFGRDNSGTIAFKNGNLTFCDDKNPHWRIKASRIWLLPGNEFAFFNALLYVGFFPVLYLPAFYYPKDELVFNPVFGLRSREGYFFQTTTYLYGRKPLDTTSSSDDSDDDSSLYNFLRPSTLKQQERQGLMIHNLDEDYKGSTDNYLKIMADWYANLGGMAGLEGQWKPGKYISSLTGNLELGFSNTIFEDGSVYMPESSSGTVYADSSYFFGQKLPFRYSGSLDLSVSKPFKLKLSLPLYSDPYFNTDFNDRTETMDWIDYLLSNPSTTDEEDEDTTEVSSYTWSLTGSYSLPLPDFVKPYISSVSLSSFSSSIAFAAVSAALDSTDDDWESYTPERKFYSPSLIIPLKAALTVTGTLFSYKSGAASASSAGADYEFGLTAPENLTVPDQKKESAADSTSDKGNDPEKSPESPQSSAPSATAGDPEKSTDTAFDESALPKIAYAAPDIQTLDLLSYTLSYKISISYTSQIAYSTDPDDIPTGADFSWTNQKSRMYILKVPIALTSSLGYLGNLFNMNNTLEFDPVMQDHPYISDEYYSSSSSASLKKTDYAARQADIVNTNKISIKPFSYTQYFKDTGITYNTTLKLLRTEFIGDADNPDWDYLTLDWTDEDSVTTHSLDFTFSADEGNDFSQSLILSTTLPPQVDEYYGTLELSFPFVTFSAETGIEQESSTDSTWVKEDFKQALSVKLFSNILKFTESYNYDLEESHSDSMKLALTWADLQLSYVMKYTYGYDFDSDDGWVERDKEEFLPYSFNLAYSTQNKKFTYWNNKISFAPSLSTSIVADLLEPTNSYFKFIPAFTFKINDFLDLTFSSESRNDVIYRYVQDGLGESGRIPGETNVFTDLLNSFMFNDDAKRKASGFKLESFSVEITHDLHDWDLNVDFEIEPRFISSTQSYDFSPYFSVSVVWRPMQGMKTEIVDDYGTWELNPD